MLSLACYINLKAGIGIIITASSHNPHHTTVIRIKIQLRWPNFSCQIAVVEALIEEADIPATSVEEDLIKKVN